MSAGRATSGPAALDRGQVWKKLGAPTDQEGSVNDPRTQLEHGVRWNEKWIYRGEDGRSIERIVLWNRYDLAGISCVSVARCTSSTRPGTE